MKTLKCLILNLFVASQLYAQTGVGTYVNPTPQLQVIVDTISLARNCAYAKDFASADRLLSMYNANKSDVYGLSLHALIIYWMKDFDRSIDLYQNTIKLFPTTAFLYLDYGRVLFGLGKLSEARKQLRTYRQYDSTNAEEKIMTAYLNLWNSKIGLAGRQADALLEKYPGNKEATDILNTISQWTVPYMKAGARMLSDDQPLKAQAYYAEAGVFKSWLFSPTINAAMYKYHYNDTSYHSSWMQFSNTIHLGTKLQVKLKGGMFGQNGKETEFTGGAELANQIGRNFSLQAAIDRRPYQFTTTSIKSVVMEDISSVGLSYNRNDKWFGKLGYEHYSYDDANKINVVYLWILAPVYSSPHFSFSGGYAFRYADAHSTTFTSKKSMDEVVGNWPPVNGIPGVYVPYFTPESQLAHSAIASIKISPSKKISLRSSMTVAFSAKADNPYLYVDVHDSGLFFNSGFAGVSYTPLSWVNELSIAASRKFYITANYSYDKLLYYNSHNASLELKYLFAK